MRPCQRCTELQCCPIIARVVEAGLLTLRNAAVEGGLELVEIWVESPNEYAAAFGVMRGAGVEALVLVPTPEINRDTEQLGELVGESRITDDWRPSRKRPTRPANWLWPKYQRT